MGYGIQLEGRNFNVVATNNPKYGISVRGIKTNKAPNSLIETNDENKADYIKILPSFKSKNSSDKGRSIRLSDFIGLKMYYIGYNQYDPIYGLKIDQHKVGVNNLISNVNSITISSKDSNISSERREQTTDYSYNHPSHLISSYNMQIQNWERAKQAYDNAMNMARITGKNPGFVFNPGNPPIYSGPTGRVNISSITTTVYLSFSTILVTDGYYIQKQDLLKYLTSVKDLALPNSQGWVSGSNLKVNFEELLLKTTNTEYVIINHNGRYYNVSGNNYENKSIISNSKSSLLTNKVKNMMVYSITLF